MGNFVKSTLEITSTGLANIYHGLYIIMISLYHLVNFGKYSLHITTMIFMSDWCHFITRVAVFNQPYRSLSLAYDLHSSISSRPEVWRECSPPPMCNMSHVKCHNSLILIIFFLNKVVELVGGWSVINGAYLV